MPATGVVVVGHDEQGVWQLTTLDAHPLGDTTQRLAATHMPAAVAHRPCVRRGEIGAARRRPGSPPRSARNADAPSRQRGAERLRPPRASDQERPRQGSRVFEAPPVLVRVHLAELPPWCAQRAAGCRRASTTARPKTMSSPRRRAGATWSPFATSGQRRQTASTCTTAGHGRRDRRGLEDHARLVRRGRDGLHGCALGYVVGPLHGVAAGLPITCPGRPTRPRNHAARLRQPLRPLS